MSGASAIAVMVGNARFTAAKKAAHHRVSPTWRSWMAKSSSSATPSLTARHTPGHTPEDTTYLVAEADWPELPYAIFSGGSLLINAAGRTDLLGPEEAQALTTAEYRTLYDFYLKLDDRVITHPIYSCTCT